jgi:DNA-binding transcriptional LysR family regulator
MFFIALINEYLYIPLHPLKVFAAVAQEKNFTLASHKPHLTQPVV